MGAGGSVAGERDPRPGTTRIPPIYALSTGGGKDATLALQRARGEGLDVRYALVIYEGSSGRIRFHGTRIDLVQAHARALGLEPVLAHTHPADFEAVFLQGVERLREMGVGGLIFGNIHLDDVRAWYEERVRDAGLEHREPLWGQEPHDLAREVVDAGFSATVVSVDLSRGDAAWLGRDLSHELLEAVAAHGADPCGEHGEYHTFVREGPGFRRPVSVRPGETVEMEGHRLLDLVLEPEA